MQKRLGALGAALLGSFVIVACVAAFTTNGGKPSPGPTRTVTQSPAAPASSTGSTASTALEKDEYVYTLVPPGIRSAGSVEVMVAAGSAGSAALDDALVHALGTVMGVNWVLVPVNASDQAIVGDVQSSHNGIQIGLSDITETESRQKQVDFITYLTASDGQHGIAFSKNNGLEEATEAALIVLIADGKYQQLFPQWHPPKATPINTATSVTINAATS